MGIFLFQIPIGRRWRHLLVMTRWLTGQPGKARGAAGHQAWDTWFGPRRAHPAAPLPQPWTRPRSEAPNLEAAASRWPGRRGLHPGFASGAWAWEWGQRCSIRDTLSLSARRALHRLLLTVGNHYVPDPSCSQESACVRERRVIAGALGQRAGVSLRGAVSRFFLQTRETPLCCIHPYTTNIDGNQSLGCTRPTDG